MHLMSTDLPAPLSPARAVTWPAGTSRLTSASACTGPKFLSMPRSWSSASPGPMALLDAGGGAGGGHCGDAEVRRLHRLVLNHSGGHVVGLHPRRGEEHRRDVGVGGQVLGRAVDQRGGDGLAGAEEHG